MCELITHLTDDAIECRSYGIFRISWMQQCNVLLQRILVLENLNAVATLILAGVGVFVQVIHQIGVFGECGRAFGTLNHRKS
jgi:hypothetical protein